jgi:ssDNA-binding Zn-finger/Zn-ribbon topoisomerase 1
MAEKKAKTAQKSADAVARSHACPQCGSDSRVIYFTGFGPKGFFWVCEKDCGYSERTR